MDMNERVRYLRESILKIKSQGRFGKKVGLSASTISAIESGKTPLKEANLKAICAEYRILEVWLRTGEGEVFVPFKSDFEKELEGLDILAPDETELIGIYRQLELPGKESVRNFADERLELQRLREAKKKITIVDVAVPFKAVSGGEESL
jgi:transcriptional regulator with XRE-family HTH domain